MFLGTIYVAIGNLSAVTVRNNINTQKEDFNKYLIVCYYSLMSLAFAVGLEPLDCLAHAYNEISPRTGYLNEQGVFIKESDLKA